MALPDSAMRLGVGGVDREATRDRALGGATQVSSPHRSASPRGCVRASQFAPSVRGQLLTQNLEPSSPEPHRASMRSGRGREEGEHYRLPARDRPSDRLEPPPPRRSAPARPRKPFPQALWVELRQRLPETAAPGRLGGQRRPLTPRQPLQVAPVPRREKSLPRKMKPLGRELGLFPRGTHPPRSRTLLGEGPPRSRGTWKGT